MWWVAYAARMRFVVYGVGAVGGVTAALLARAGHDVIAIARGAHHDAIAGNGLRVQTPDETFVEKLPVAPHPSHIEWRGDDVVLLAVKTQDIAGCVRELAPFDPVTACLTNGVEAERIAARHLSRVLGACIFMPATHLEPGTVQARSWPLAGAIDLGSYPTGAPPVSLEVPGLRSTPTADIMRFKRGKLLSNLANGAEALCGPEARQSRIAEGARAEAIACFEAAGLSRTTEAEDAERRIGIASRPVPGAPRSAGSTWQSLARGASLEVDYLNGEIVLLGRQLGVPTPINRGLQRLANAAARAGARPGAMSLADLEAALRR
jgi:2-dehydropantoate 2-reductase